MGGAAGAGVGFIVGGVGAFPGAAIGAATGAQAGAWVLGLLGLASRVESLGTALGQALSGYASGIENAWGPTEWHPHRYPARAPHDFARGHEVRAMALRLGGRERKPAGGTPGAHADRASAPASRAKRDTGPAMTPSQLQGQQGGLNEMTVDEYLKGREAFDPSARDPGVAKKARAKYLKETADQLFGQLRDQGMSPREVRRAADKAATDKMKTMAALRNPDMYAAGKDVIADFGDRGVNSRIGAQWKTQGRMIGLDEAARSAPKNRTGHHQDERKPGTMQVRVRAMPVDEDFEYFLEAMGPSIDRRDVPASTIERYRGNSPTSSFHIGRNMAGVAMPMACSGPWTPKNMSPSWMPGSAAHPSSFMEEDAQHIVARGAFGDLYFWGERTGYSLNLSAPYALALPITGRTGSLDQRTQRFFSSCDRDENDLDGLFAPALKKLGRLKHDEMQGFVPALALGGPSELSHLQKVKAVEHLVILAQLSELRVLNGPNL